MFVRLIVLAATLALIGCTPATLIDETRTVAVLDSGFNAGESYEIYTRTLEGKNGRFEQTRVIYRGRSAICLRDSPNDCEFKARNLIDGYRDRFF